ncbi:MAG: hypothetical protein IKH11_06110 [Bacteroidales bacterium]|nr:hypothetical protein [Bacteroidales bacterium]
MLPIAKILKSNGTEGEILIGLLDIDAEEINTEEPVFVVFDGLPVPFFIEKLTPKGGTRAIVRLTDCRNLADAEELVGKEICLDVEDDGADEESLIGWSLYNGDTFVGIISGTEDIPGNPCLQVGDSLVPLHQDLIVSVDKASRTIVMDLPEGLL